MKQSRSTKGIKRPYQLHMHQKSIFQQTKKASKDPRLLMKTPQNDAFNNFCPFYIVTFPEFMFDDSSNIRSTAELLPQ